MHTRISQMLLESVYFRVSAMVSIGECGELLGVKLLSTDWPQERLVIEKNAREVWLISNHPDGMRMPYPQDVHNRQWIASISEGVRVRLFLSSEYFSCFEAEDGQV